MKTLLRPLLCALLAACLVNGCARSDAAPAETAKPGGMIGAWRSQIRFNSGAFAAVKDLEFMYVFNQGGTLTESSNYDAAPPVPPAYGIWRPVGPGQFEAKYYFYMTAPPTKFEQLAGGGGWGPAGYGIFIEHIALSKDGRTYTSTIDFSAFDGQGKPAEGGGTATGSGARMTF